MDQVNDNKESQHPAEVNHVEAPTESPEINRKEAENAVEVFIEPSEMNTGEPENPVEKEAENAVEVSIEPSEMNTGELEIPVEKEPENAVKVYIEQSEMKTGEPENPVEASFEVNSSVVGVSGEKPTKTESSKKKIVKSLKAKSVVKKKPTSGIALDAKKVEASPQIRRKILKKNRKLSQGSEGGNKNDPAKESNVNAREASTKSPEINRKEAENAVEVSIEPSEMNTGEPQNPVQASAKSFEMNSSVVGVSGEKPTRTESSKKRIVKSLKAKSVIKKKPSSGIALDAKKVEASPQIRRKILKKNRKLSQGSEGGNKNDTAKESNVNAREEKLGKDVAEIEPTRKSQQSNKNQEEISGPSSSQHNHRSENNRDGQGKRSRRRNKKRKLDVREGIKGDQKKKGMLGGLIFMCSAKTKPDCFRYQVMGVTLSKKDLVLGVRPGLKLFLYDFDLKLMYGVYKASSAGGMRLEPKAFGGSFPVQVRFRVHKDCVPLPESVFKKAIKENYDGKNKFGVELTVQQVRKLSALFRPVGFQPVQPAAMPVHSLSGATNRDREVERSRDSRLHLDRETYPPVNVDSRGYPVHSHERERDRDKQPVRREVVSIRREQASRDFYMSEKEYRAYGLQRERRNLTPRTIDPYQRDLERERLSRQPASPYRETVPFHRDLIIADPRYSESQTYDYSGRSALPSAVPSASAITAFDSYTRDPYYTFPHNSSSGNAYVRPSRKEEVSSGSYYVDGRSRRDVYLEAVDPLRRRETAEMDMDKLYLKYSVDPPRDYSRTNQAPMPEAVMPPVSSRYSFAGPSVSYR